MIPPGLVFTVITILSTCIHLVVTQTTLTAFPSALPTTLLQPFRLKYECPTSGCTATDTLDMEITYASPPTPGQTLITPTTAVIQWINQLTPTAPILITTNTFTDLSSDTVQIGFDYPAGTVLLGELVLAVATLEADHFYSAEPSFSINLINSSGPHILSAPFPYYTTPYQDGQILPVLDFEYYMASTNSIIVDNNQIPSTPIAFQHFTISLPKTTFSPQSLQIFPMMGLVYTPQTSTTPGVTLTCIINSILYRVEVKTTTDGTFFFQVENLQSTTLSQTVIQCQIPFFSFRTPNPINTTRPIPGNDFSLIVVMCTQSTPPTTSPSFTTVPAQYSYWFRSSPSSNDKGINIIVYPPGFALHVPALVPIQVFTDPVQTVSFNTNTSEIIQYDGVHSFIPNSSTTNNPGLTTVEMLHTAFVVEFVTTQTPGGLTIDILRNLEVTLELDWGRIGDSGEKLSSNLTIHQISWLLIADVDYDISTDAVANVREPYSPTPLDNDGYETQYEFGPNSFTVQQHPKRSTNRHSLDILQHNINTLKNPTREHGSDQVFQPQQTTPRTSVRLSTDIPINTGVLNTTSIPSTGGDRSDLVVDSTIPEIQTNTWVSEPFYLLVPSESNTSSSLPLFQIPSRIEESDDFQLTRTRYKLSFDITFLSPTNSIDDSSVLSKISPTFTVTASYHLDSLGLVTNPPYPPELTQYTAPLVIAIPDSPNSTSETPTTTPPDFTSLVLNGTFTLFPHTPPGIITSDPAHFGNQIRDQVIHDQSTLEDLNSANSANQPSNHPSPFTTQQIIDESTPIPAFHQYTFELSFYTNQPTMYGITMSILSGQYTFFGNFQRCKLNGFNVTFIELDDLYTNPNLQPNESEGMQDGDNTLVNPNMYQAITFLTSTETTPDLTKPNPPTFIRIGLDGAPEYVDHGTNPPNTLSCMSPTSTILDFASLYSYTYHIALDHHPHPIDESYMTIDESIGPDDVSSIPQDVLTTAATVGNKPSTPTSIHQSSLPAFNFQNTIVQSDIPVVHLPYFQPEIPYFLQIPISLTPHIKSPIITSKSTLPSLPCPIYELQYGFGTLTTIPDQPFRGGGNSKRTWVIITVCGIAAMVCGSCISIGRFVYKTWMNGE